MPASNLKSLIGKLNTTCRSALESAAGLCLSQTHYEVDIEHFLIKLLEIANTDMQKILRHFEINEARLVSDLTRTMEGFKTGNARTPALSPRIPSMIQEAWLVASVDFQAPSIRSGHILLSLMSNDEMARMLSGSSESFKKISVETLREHLTDLTSGSVEETDAAQPALAEDAAGRRMPAGKAQALAQYTINLTERARKGEIDPVLGRDFEIRQMVDILIRRRQNNPILTGEAGVGKTAVVEGFALRIVEGDIPPPLKNVAIHTLDLGLLQAGAGIKGEFENRLKSVIDEVKASPIPIILFIDEAHTLIGAGGSAGSGDAANMLKPALARGELRTIAATTWSEYKKYFEKDAALARRFQVVKIEEPEEEKALMMMRAIAPFLEHHHNVMITDDALFDAVHLSHRYLTGRQLPDKSVSVLDTACARVAIGLNTSPSAIEEATRNIGRIDREMKILQREELIGHEHVERIRSLVTEKEAALTRLDDLTQKWQKEMEIANRVIDVRKKIEEIHEKDPSDKQALSEKQDVLKGLKKELAEAQGGSPLVQIMVDPEIISEVISGWTGIPTGRMLTDEIETVLNMADLLAERIIGQDYALDAVAQMIQTAHAGIEDPSKPTAVFLFVGPSGVGKTETALVLSEVLYGGEENVITINMSEYQEAHTVSGLKGSPPGYVGYGEGGVLTEAVRRRPYSVVLLDEVEKAHPDVMELFYQVFDKGMLEDGEGRRIDFKNTLIILTSNLGTDMIMKVCADEETMPDAPALTEMLRPELLKRFKPAFLGRLKVVPFFPITDKNMRLIVKLKLDRIAKRMLENRNVTFKYNEELIESIGSRCTEVDSGARNVDHILTNTLLPEMSKELLSRMATGEQIKEVKVSLGEAGFVFEVI
ncbi:MAG: type VI secretion system ATPase TssH [Deltaproteobacteria bacterium]|jgi:type VI secretion system protein VasG|nr:type VI secretion system ATPase TssH [Deltaproteobacteria bacterium]